MEDGILGYPGTSTVTRQSLDSEVLPWLAIPQPSHESPCSLPDTFHTEFAVGPGRGGGWQKGVDKAIKDMQETAQSYNHNFPGAATGTF